MTGDGGVVDNDAAALPEHNRQFILHGEKDSLRVGVHHVRPFFQRRVGNSLEGADKCTRVVEGDVNSTVFLYAAIDEGKRNKRVL